VRPIAIAAILEEDELRPRALLQHDVVTEYAQRMKAGDVFPPALVYIINDQYWLVDGYHRVAAAKVNNLESIVCEIRSGTLLDAAWMGYASNRQHGLRRSNADKRRSVLRALVHPKGQKLSDRQISRHCGVHHDTVGRWRRELQRAGRIRHINERISVRGSSSYVQRIDGITRSNAARSSAASGMTGALSRVSTSNSESESDGCPALLTQAVSTLDTVGSLMARLETQLGSIAHEMSRLAWCRESLDLANACTTCIRIQRAVNAIYALLAGRQPQPAAFSACEPIGSRRQIGDAS
jgi:hypothetical protein